MTLYANTCENPVDLAPLGGGDTANPPFVYATGTVYQPSGTLNAIWYGERQAYCNGSTGSNVPPNVPC